MHLQTASIFVKLVFNLFQNGATPLIIASQHGHSDIVSLLVQYGATVDLQAKVSNQENDELQKQFI